MRPPKGKPPKGKGGKGSATQTQSKSSGGKKQSLMNTLCEFVLFILWLVCTGVLGYFIGHSPVIQDCTLQPDVSLSSSAPAVVRNEVREVKCVYDNAATGGAGVAVGATPTAAQSYDEVTRLWKCSHAVSNFSQANQKILPKEKNLDKTKWKSIISVEPKAFFDKYLSQYPADTRAVQPVVVFSHKPLDDFKDISEVCKVVDVAVVPDTPGVCVAVTETFHDVASYHMLHAEKQKDGTFALTSSSLEGRTLPEEPNYAAAREMLLHYFNNVDYVNKAVKTCPSFSQGRVAVGSWVDSEEELVLYRNSIASGFKEGISKGKFCAFTSVKSVYDQVKKMGLYAVHLPVLADVGRKGNQVVSEAMRRHFIQAWIAFAGANANKKIMWVAPSTVWLDRPDNVVTSSPMVETLWAFTGRDDQRAAPFFASFDFFVPTGHERPVHLLHEIMLHFDLVLAWNSIDALASYRLSENNARYEDELTCV
jgi:hypothetical protein